MPILTYGPSALTRLRRLVNRSLALVLACFGVAVYPTLDFAADDLRLLQTYSLDEAAFATQVREMVDTGSLAVDGFTYGSLYSYLGVLLASLWGLFFEVTDTAIISILRLISLAAALVTAVVTTRLCRLTVESTYWLPSALLVISTPIVFRWTVEIHPDLLQLCFLTLSLERTLHLTRTYARGTAVTAALFAGLAMGTKYGGIFILPVLALAIFLGLPGDPRERLRDTRLWIDGALSAAAFAIAYAVTNPYAVADIPALLRDLEFAGRIVSDADASPFAWVLSGARNAPLVALSIPVALALGLRRSWREDVRIGLLLVWLLGYFAFLVFSVRFIAGQYLLPLVPAAVTLLCFAATRWLGSIGLVGWCGVTMVIGFLHLEGVAPVARARAADGSDNPVVAAGRWLGDSYATETTILYDTYAYVPAKFELTDTYYGLAYPVIEIYKPDLVVTRKSIRERYADPERSDHFRLTDDPDEQASFLYLSPERYRNIHYTYRYLREGITNYRTVKDFDDVTVYERKERVEGGVERWERIKAAQKGEGVEANLAAEAYRVFGDVHAAAGNLPEAKDQYARAANLAPGNILPRYAYTLALARQDSFARADSLAVDLERLTTRPADIWLKLGWDYCQIGAYARSRQASRRALTLDPDLPYPRYNIALAWLLEDRLDSAAVAYGEARARHSLPAPTEDYLRRLVHENRLSERARTLVGYVLGQSSPTPGSP